MDSSSLTDSKESTNNEQPYICQICGEIIHIDQSIEQISEAQSKHLIASFTTRDDNIDAVTTISDADIEIYTPNNMHATVHSGTLLLKSQLSNNPPNTIYQEQQQQQQYQQQYQQPTFQLNTQQRQIQLKNLQSFNSMSESMQNITSNTHITGMYSKIKSLSALFDLMSTNTNIDHPLCEECASDMVNQLDSQCKQIERQHMEYTNLIDKLNKESQVKSDNLCELEAELQALEIEECKLLAEYETHEREEQELLKEIEKKQDEEVRLVREEERLLMEFNSSERKQLQMEERQSSLENQCAQHNLHLERLRTTNVLNAAFHIWYSGSFGTINFFRLGKLSDTPVEWDEINAGLGQTALLLYSLALKMKLEFKYFKLVPYGNNSYIQAIESVPQMDIRKDDRLHLYGSGSSKYHSDSNRKLDDGLAAFLHCLKQLEDIIKTRDKSFSLPYIIQGSKLVDTKTKSSFSIKCKFNSYEEWTKALKYMLTNLKWALAWVASQSCPT